ncbi:MAG TPA: tRNA pseudouridine(55) synthase TruB [Clostridiales bacterium]|nr:tRNA pseudouridine(55) synthase TruB [Clostridiales bacterium]
MLGFISVNKKKGDTSAFVVNRIKRLVGKGSHIGHMGTLDPLASGVLPVAIGQATRLFPFLLDKRKSYLADFDFSFTTPSLDLETEPTLTTVKRTTEKEILSVLPSLIGEVMQVPPVYSAKCVDGKRSYKLARRGVEVELQPKKVQIDDIRLVEKLSETCFRFEIDCRGGTYIRSIARDLGAALDLPATMTNLVRTRSGIFTIENSFTLDEIEEKGLSACLVEPDKTVFYPELKLTAEEEKRLLNGLYDDFSVENGLCKVYGEAGFLGVGEVTDKKLKMKAYVRDL